MSATRTPRRLAAVLTAVMATAAAITLGACPGPPPTPPELPCDKGDPGCRCTDLRTCEQGAQCFQQWCWGGAHPAPDTYYYTQKNLDDTQAVREVVKAALALKPGQVVADIGCGQGYLSYAAAEQLGPSGRVIATDLDPAALEHTRRYIETAETPGGLASIRTVHVIAPRDTGLDQEPDGSIDLILMINSVAFEDVDSATTQADVAYLQSCRAKLRPGGRLLYHRDWLDEEDLHRPDAAALLRAAGYELLEDLALPPGIPERTYFKPRGPLGQDVELDRGFILVARAPRG